MEDLQMVQNIDLTLTNEDIGEAIDITTISNIKNKRKNNKNKQNNNSKAQLNQSSKELEEEHCNIKKVIDDLGSFNEINSFVKKENSLRLSDKQKCIYRNIDDQKWKKVMKFIKKHAKKGHDNGIFKTKNVLQAALKE